MTKQILIPPSKARKYIHTAEGILHISELFPAKMLRDDQKRIPAEHKRTSIKRPN